jgi:tetratricopeptide (TPR) repeat protein
MKQQMIFLFTVLSAFVGAAIADELRGKITKTTGQEAQITLEGELVPNVGDSATIFFKLPGSDDEVRVANGHVTAADGVTTTVAIDKSLGTVQKDQLARITSQNPKPKIAGSATAGPKAQTESTPPPDNLASTEAEGFYKKGDYDRAVAALNRVIEINPNNAAAYHERAVCYSAKQAWDNVIADASRALDLGYSHPALPFSSRGIARTEKNDFRGALEDFDQAIARQPDFGLAYYHRARARMRMSGATPEALQDINKAISLSPQMAPAYYVRGLYYRSIGASQKADADWKEALALDPALANQIEFAKRQVPQPKKPSRKKQ